MDKFKTITLQGTALERGLAHGHALRDEIRRVIDYYRSIFGLPEHQILDRARYFSGRIAAFEPDYMDEINGIAQGAQVDPLWVVALNARTEILSMNPASSNECTAICFPEAALLGQNWDWGHALEDLSVIVKIKRADQCIRMITEPGIIGKIGMNSSGVGVCLNILRLPGEQTGLPIHIVLRAILDCRSLGEVKGLIASHGSGKASNILVCNDQGEAFDIEFAGRERFMFTENDGFLVHTNHYLGKPANAYDELSLSSSHARLDIAHQRLGESGAQSVDRLQAIFSDRSNPDLPIYRGYVADPVVKRIGTICTIIMDLKAQHLHIRKGNRTDATFSTYPVC